MTFTFRTMASSAKFFFFTRSRRRLAFSPSALPSAIIRFEMSTRACLTKWEMSPGLAPCSMTAVVPLSQLSTIFLRRICLAYSDFSKGSLDSISETESHTSTEVLM